MILLFCRFLFSLFVPRISRNSSIYPYLRSLLGEKYCTIVPMVQLLLSSVLFFSSKLFIITYRKSQYDSKIQNPGSRFFEFHPLEPYRPMVSRNFLRKSKKHFCTQWNSTSSGGQSISDNFYWNPMTLYTEKIANPLSSWLAIAKLHKILNALTASFHQLNACITFQKFKWTKIFVEDTTTPYVLLQFFRTKKDRLVKTTCHFLEFHSYFSYNID